MNRQRYEDGISNIKLIIIAAVFAVFLSCDNREPELPQKMIRQSFSFQPEVGVWDNSRVVKQWGI